MKSLNIVFAGTPEIAATTLAGLLDSRHRIQAVYTQPDRRAGRGKHLHPSAVKKLARAHEIPVYQPRTLKHNPECIAQLKALDPDVILVVAYGLIFPKEILELPRYGCLNIHTSLLPEYRGAAPVQRAILNGETETGLTMMQMDEGMDTGPILEIQRITISAHDTTASLTDRMARHCAPFALATLDALTDGHILPIDQPFSGTSAPRISKEEAHISWYQSASAIHNRIRAFYPWPCTYTYMHHQPVKVMGSDIIEHNEQKPCGVVTAVNRNGILVQTGDGLLNITHLQLPGKKVMEVAALLNGRHLHGLTGTLLY